jgi:hypothetical protein
LIEVQKTEQMKKCFKLCLLVIAVILVILIITNPSPEKFRSELPVITNIPNEAFLADEVKYGLVFGRETDFFIFSIYSLKVDIGIEKYNQDKRILGILGNFFVIEHRYGYTWD